MDPSQDSCRTELIEILSRLNRTELYQTCRRAGLPVQPYWMVDRYISALIDGCASEHEHSVDRMRDGLVAFIDEYWTTLQAQLKCPAKNLHNPDPEKATPKPCHNCLDMQVVACVSNMSAASQQRLLHLLQIRNKP